MQALGLVLWKHLVSGHDERVEIRDGSAWRQDRVALSESNYVAHLFEHKVLHQNEDGRNFVGEPGGSLAE